MPLCLISTSAGRVMPWLSEWQQKIEGWQASCKDKNKLTLKLCSSVIGLLGCSGPEFVGSEIVSTGQNVGF